jgi:hypothetical protein
MGSGSVAGRELDRIICILNFCLNQPASVSVVISTLSAYLPAALTNFQAVQNVSVEIKRRKLAAVIATVSPIAVELAGGSHHTKRILLVDIG